MTTTCSLAGDVPLAKITTEQPAYEYTTWRKVSIVFTASWMAFTVSFSSAVLFPAIPDIAADFNTSRTTIDVSNAAVFVCLALSAFFWVPMMEIVGRRYTWYIAALVLLAFSIATAAAPTIETWVAMRCVSLLQGTVFHIAGQSVIADIFPPAKRGMAIGCFLVGTITGPALGPCVGGIIVTFASWRVIFWVQCAMIGFGAVLSVFFYPSEIEAANEGLKPRPDRNRASIMSAFNPLHILRLFLHPNLLLTHLACALLSFSQYGLLVSPRHIINPRFNLTTPLVSGLFYLSPLFGFILGTLAGGRYSDFTVRHYVDKYSRRRPQDRLKAGLWCFFALIPVSTMVYAWCLMYKKGGLVVPIIAAFFWAAGLLAAFGGLNTYCVEACPSQRTRVVAGKYFVQYLGGAAATGGFVPMIDGIGVGMTGTATVGMVLIAGVLTSTVATHAESWQTKKVETKEMGAIIQNYINDLEDEIKRLKSQSAATSPNLTETVEPQSAVVTGVTTQHILPATSVSDATSEHVFDHDPWFVDYKSHDGPVYIGEAACTGFTTRCRQVFSSVTGVDGKHMVRTHFISDEKFSEFSATTPCRWPTYNQATLLARVVQGTIGSYYNLCRWDVLFKDLKNLYAAPTVPGKHLTCKLYVIFALGEVYSARSGSTGGYPGLQYFLRANREVSGRPERPRTESIEIAVMLALYSLILNRRDACYFWIGSALRMSMTQGMHHSIPQHQAADVAMMEHRTRLWWTVYVLDRMCSAMMSHPVSIPDTDIDIRLPSDPKNIPGITNGSELIDHEFLIATINLARILGDISSSLYTRAKAQRSSLHRVQTLLKSLQNWHDTLPKHLQLPQSKPIQQVPRPVATMHGWFNQCIILTTRPVLLYVLRNQLSSLPRPSSIPGTIVPSSTTANYQKGPPDYSTASSAPFHPLSQPSYPPSSQTSYTTSSLPDPSSAFAETCIRCAKENIRILTGLWVQGSFSTFAYFYSNYLFSAGVTLGVASQLPLSNSDPDTCTEGFEFALQTLKHLTDCGNLPAREFHKNLDALKAQIVKYDELKTQNRSQTLDNGDVERQVGGAQRSFGDEAGFLEGAGLDANVFSEPALQGFLAQPSFELPDIADGDPDLAFLYTWPDELGDVVMDGMGTGL
ncbi:MFS antiporter-like protein 2 [Elsinoe fawcettii]|nr:MFS antiporter-like protein 2 [Elsinoe fawcettii]